MSEYRDPLAGLRSQIATKRGVAIDRERRVTAALRALLPSRLDERIGATRSRALALPDASEPSSLDGLVAVDAALDELLALYDEALEKEESARRLSFELPDPPRPDQPPPWLIEERQLLSFRAAVEALLATTTEEPGLVRWGDAAYVARFHHHGIRHALWVSASFDPNLYEISSFEAHVRTLMPERVPALSLSPERVHHAIGKALHLAEDLETGDAILDEAYWIKGDVRAVALLDDRARRILARISALRPTLRFGGGMASVSWRASWAPARPLHPIGDVLELTGALHDVVESG